MTFRRRSHEGDGGDLVAIVAVHLTALTTMCYFSRTCVIKITLRAHGETARDHDAHPTRTPDHGHPLPARPRDGRRGDGGAARRSQLFHRPDAASRARRKGPPAPP